MFNLDKDSDVTAKTSSSKSETRTVTEYELSLDLPEYGVRGIKIGIVDSPGFNDTDGIKQDACNFYAIKKFYETHPSASRKQRVYPNLIFVTIPASDSRIEGESSLLAKSLRSLAQLELVDPNVPNVVGVITKAAQFSRDKKVWLEQFSQKKDAFKNILFKQFDVSSEVIALENFPAQEGCQKKGDYYYLPDKKTLQPQNLFRVCKNLLRENGDRLGYIAFLDGFRTKKMKPKIGFRLDAKSAKNSVLSEEEKEATHAMLLAAEGKSINETLSDHAMTFIMENSLHGTEDGSSIQTMCLELKKYNVTVPEQVIKMTKNGISFLMGAELSQATRDFLEHLQVTDGIPSTLDDEMLLIGQGYNILTDKTVPRSILKLDSRNTKLGVAVPTPAKIVKLNQTRFFMHNFQSKEELFRKRQNSLNISLNIDLALYKGGGRAGFSVGDESSDWSSVQEYSFLVEQRFFQVSIPSLEDLSFTDDFKSSVGDLPEKFDLKDAENRSAYEKFFNTFGHFVILEAFGGGSIVVKTSSSSCSKRNFHEIKHELAASFNRGLMGVLSVGVNGGSSTDSRVDSKHDSILETSCFEFNGGNPELHKKDTITDPKLMNQWKMSLSQNLAMLETDLSLAPISDVVETIEKKKGMMCYKALEHFLGGKFKTIESEEKQRIEMLKKELEWIRSRDKAMEEKECFSREQDVKREKCNPLWYLVGYSWLWGAD